VLTAKLRLMPYVLEGGDEFSDPESYQSRALQKTEQEVGILTMSDAKIVQYYALYCIFEATSAASNMIIESDPRFTDIQIPGWSNQTGWLSNNLDPCEGWHGITCDENKVTKVELYRNRLTGNFPHEVTLLASDGPRSTGAGNLNRLDLFKNEFLFNEFDNSWMSHLGSNMGKWVIHSFD
jgi:hypothetical protein